ncbi:hypothetical protein A2U01_0097260, partial [Trifolium medium]|nr:hypothetical protein [Trifolium medium]
MKFAKKCIKKGSKRCNNKFNKKFNNFFRLNGVRLWWRWWRRERNK